jgi:hypothetical protein
LTSGQLDLKAVDKTILISCQPLGRTSVSGSGDTLPIKKQNSQNELLTSETSAENHPIMVASKEKFKLAKKATTEE